jgi:hypothetical protein
MRGFMRGVDDSFKGRPFFLDGHAAAGPIVAAVIGPRIGKLRDGAHSAAAAPAVPML